MTINAPTHLTEIPTSFFQNRAFCQDEAFRQMCVAVFGASNGVTVERQELLLARASTSSSFGVWRVSLRRHDSEQDVVLKIIGDDFNADRQFRLAGSPNKQDVHYYRRESDIYSDPTILTAMSSGGDSRFVKAYSVSEERPTTTKRGTFRAYGVWMEYLPQAFVDDVKPAYAFLDVANLIGNRDALLVVRSTLPMLLPGDPPKTSTLSWLANASFKKAFDESVVGQPSAYDSNNWNSKRHSATDARRSALERAAQVWEQRDVYSKHLDSPKRMRILTPGDMHSGNFDFVCDDDGSVRLVLFDLATAGMHPIGQDMAELMSSAVGSIGWIPHTRPDAHEVATQLQSRYFGAMKRTLRKHSVPDRFIQAIVDEASQNIAARTALGCIWAGRMLDPRYEEFYGKDANPRFTTNVFEYLELTADFSERFLTRVNSREM